MGGFFTLAVLVRRPGVGIWQCISNIGFTRSILSSSSAISRVKQNFIKNNIDCNFRLCDLKLVELADLCIVSAPKGLTTQAGITLTKKMPRTKAKPKAATPTVNSIKVENGIQNETEETINSIKSSRSRSKEIIVKADAEEVKATKKAPSTGRGKRKILEQTNEELEEAVELKESKTVVKGRSKKASTPASKTKKNIKPEVEESPPAEEVKPTTNRRGRKASTSSSAATSTVDEIKTEVEETAKKPKGRASKKAGSVASDDAPTPKKRAKSEPKTTKETKTPTTTTSSAVKAKRKNNTKRELNSIEEIAEDVNYEETVVPVVAEKRTRGRKRAAAPAAAVAIDEEAVEEENDVADGAKPAKAKKTAATPLNSVTSKYDKADFELSTQRNILENGDAAKRFNLKISSWNVAGLRSWLKKDGLKFLDYEEPDIFCMQEIKCTTDQLPEEAARIPGYHPYWLCMPGGYAGVAIYSKIMPIHVEYGIDNPEFDSTGRIITAEYEKFFLINVYVPNSGRKLVNLEARMRWEKLFQAYVQRLDARKPVIICGDMNVSHTEIDLANPKSNTRNAGFTQEERDKMSELLALGYVDTFRHFYPQQKGAYTFWTYMGNARSRNVGWRLDYFLVSQRFLGRVVENCMRTQCMGSDHCPITLFLKL